MRLLVVAGIVGTVVGVLLAEPWRIAWTWRLPLFVIAKVYAGWTFVLLALIFVGQWSLLSRALHQSVASEWVELHSLQKQHVRVVLLLCIVGAVHGICAAIVAYNVLAMVTGTVAFTTPLALAVLARRHRSIGQLVHHAAMAPFLVCLLLHHPRLQSFLIVVLGITAIDMVVCILAHTHRVPDPRYQVASRGVLVQFPLPLGIARVAPASGSYINLYAPWVSLFQYRPFSLVVNAQRTRGLLVIQCRGWFTRTLVVQVLDRLVRSGFWINGPHYSDDNCTARTPQNQFVVASGYAITAAIHRLESSTTTLVWVTPYASLIVTMVPFLEHSLRIFCTDRSDAAFQELCNELQSQYYVEMDPGQQQLTVFVTSERLPIYIHWGRPSLPQLVRESILHREQKRRTSRDATERTLSDSFALELMERPEVRMCTQWQLRYYGNVDSIAACMSQCALDHKVSFFHEHVNFFS